MSDSELTVIDPAAEENAVIEQFAQASRDLVPSLEVTLAKRIIKPGSNRMLCLAAHTSVPLHDDEIASVSNLALRLSDGTNVALSLSFFNESESAGNFAAQYATAGAPAYIMQPQLNRYYYDPGRFVADRDSRLGAFLIAATILLATGFYGYLNSKAHPFSFSIASLQSLVSDRVTQVLPDKYSKSHVFPTASQSHTSAASRHVAVSGGDSVSARRALSVDSQKRLNQSEEKTSRKAGSHSYQKAAAPHAKSTVSPNRAASHRSDQMLVPPPPPMTPVDLAPYGGFPAWDLRLPAQSSANALRPQAKPVSPQKNKTSAPAQLKEEKQPPANLIPDAGVVSAPPVSASVNLPSKAPASSSGYAYESLHLERIVLPEQK